jgi:quercetin dioxygenase-like cupin family protein
MQPDKSEKDNSQLKGQAHRLVDLIDYQAGAVVSRTIMDKPAGTLTLFAFAEGQGLSEHTAPFDALVYLLDGEAAVTIAGQSFTLNQGETVILPANQPHALRAIRRYKMMLVMIKA